MAGGIIAGKAAGDNAPQRTQGRRRFIMSQLDRRDFLSTIPGAACGSLVLASSLAAETASPARLSPPQLTVIAGSSRERGKRYGILVRDDIRAFLDREIYRSFVGKPGSKDELLRYAGACAAATRSYSPTIHDELEGMAEGTGLGLEEIVLITLHEELCHRGVLPHVDHCTAMAVGPPDTRDGHTYVGQTWDWMRSVAGLSRMLLWQRTEGPSLLAYGYPGLPVGAGMNASGIALCWTSAGFKQEASGPRVGIPSYLLLTHLLYQESLDQIVREAKRATCAGWFTFVLGDAHGRLVNIEGSPQQLVVEEHRGKLARVSYGIPRMMGGTAAAPAKLHPRCEKMYNLLAAKKVDREVLADYFEKPSHGICHEATLDMMLFDTTRREAFVSRSANYGSQWKRFTFESTA